MTNQGAIEMLTAKAECIRREASGTDIDCNLRNCDECDLCYKQGTMGDQMEALRVAISALEFRNKYDQFWEEVKTAGMNGKETEIHHSGRVFRIREVAQ